MKEYNELFENFNNLGLDAKRNVYSEEIIKLAMILKTYLNKYDLDLFEMPYNYKSGHDKNLTESELLNINFRDIYIIKAELLILFSKLNIEITGGKRNG